MKSVHGAANDNDLVHVVVVALYGVQAAADGRCASVARTFLLRCSTTTSR